MHNDSHTGAAQGGAVSRRGFVAAAATAGAMAAGAGVASAKEGAPAASSSSDGEAGQGRPALHTWEVTPDPITDIAQTKEYDVVVVGGGMAGSGAAEAAVRSGASVVVIERSEQGRFTGLDMAAMGSKVLADAGIDIDPLECARLMYAASQQTANYRLIRT